MLNRFNERQADLVYRRLNEIVGEENFITDERIENYLTDETPLTGKASLVLLPENHDQVKDIMLTLNAHYSHLPHDERYLMKVTVRGEGSGLSGGCVPESGIVISLKKMNRILSLNKKNMSLHTEAGVITGDIRRAAAEEGLMYAPDPSSEDVSSIGGNIATNAGGPRTYLYGPTSEHLVMLRVVWGDGTDDWVGSRARKTSNGFKMLQLLPGSEGRLGIVTEAVLRLMPAVDRSEAVAAGFDSYSEAVELLHRLRKSCTAISAIEFLDEKAVAVVENEWPAELRGSKALILLNVEGEEHIVDDNLNKLVEFLPEDRTVMATDEKTRRQLWNARKGVTVALKEKYNYKLGEDSCVPVDRIADFIEYAHSLTEKTGLETVVWGHAGDGNLHVNFLYSEEQQYSRVYDGIRLLALKAVEMGGTVSGEHGLGRLKKSFQHFELTTNLIEKQSLLKKVFDPFELLNPALIGGRDHDGDDEKVDVLVPDVSEEGNLHKNPLE